MNNREIARKLLDHACELEVTGQGLFRVRAYRRAAAAVQMLSCEVSELLEQGGREALESVPGIGAHLAYTLEKLVREGEWDTLGPKPVETNPRELVMTLPGVGTKTLERMRQAGIETLADVEEAAIAGRLEAVGVRGKRLRGLLAALGARRRERQGIAPLPCEPTVADLLDIDGEFRALASESGRVGGPVLTMKRNGWTFRATFSQSPLAYRLGQARDWVVIQFENATQQGERTIVTETRPPRTGRRVVRGREPECQACWAS